MDGSLEVARLPLSGRTDIQHLEVLARCHGLGQLARGPGLERCQGATGLRPAGHSVDDAQHVVEADPSELAGDFLHVLARLGHQDHRAVEGQQPTGPHRHLIAHLQPQRSRNVPGRVGGAGPYVDQPGMVRQIGRVQHVDFLTSQGFGSHEVDPPHVGVVGGKGLESGQLPRDKGVDVRVCQHRIGPPLHPDGRDRPPGA